MNIPFIHYRYSTLPALACVLAAVFLCAAAQAGDRPDGPVESTIYGRFLTDHLSRPDARSPAFVNGAAAFPAALTISALEVSTDTATGGFRQDMPAVGRLGSRYLVYWRDHKDGVAHLYGQVRDAGLAAQGSAFSLYSDGTDRQLTYLRGASDGRTMCLTFLDDGARHVRAAFTDSAGNRMAGHQVDELPLAEFIGAPACAALAPNGFIAVWEEFRLGGFHIYGQRFDSDGARMPGLNLDLDSGADSLLRITPHAAGDTAGGYLVVWSSGDQSRSDVFVRFFDAADSPQGPAVPITAPAASESYMLPQAVYVEPSDEYWVVYVRTDAPADSTALFVRRLTRTGGFVDSAQAVAAGPYPWVPRLAVSAARVAIFTERLDNSAEIRVVELDPNGLVTDSSAVVNDAAARDRLAVASTSGADTLCVVWQDRSSGEFDVRGRLRAGGVEVSPDIKLNGEGLGGQQTEVALARREGGGLHVFFTDGQSGGGDLARVDVSDNGVILSRTVVNDDGTLAPQYDAAAAADTAGRVLVAWTDERTDWSGPARHVAGRFLQSGNFAGNAFVIPDDTTASSQSQVDCAMTFDGVATATWIDDRSNLARAYKRTFDATGNPVGGDVALNDGAQAQLVVAWEEDPVISTDASGRLWTAWSVRDVITDSFYVLGQAWNADGSRRGGNVDLSPTGPAAEPLDFDIRALPSGDARLAWFDPRPGREGIWTEVYDTAGAAAGALIRLSSLGITARQPTIDFGVEGRWAVAWSQTNGPAEEIVWHRFEADGTPIGGVERISSDSLASRRRAPALEFSGTYLYGAWHDNDIPGQGYDVRISSILKSPAGVSDEGAVLPERIQLYPNYPNPFNPGTVISYSLHAPARVELAVFDLLGRHVRTLVSDPQPAGTYRYEWNGLDTRGVEVGSGLYFYRLRAGNEIQSRKMLLLR